MQSYASYSFYINIGVVLTTQTLCTILLGSHPAILFSNCYCFPFFTIFSLLLHYFSSTLPCFFPSTSKRLWLDMDNLLHRKRTFPCSRHFSELQQPILCGERCTRAPLSQSKPNTPINHTNVFIATRESRLLIVGSSSDLLVVFLNGSK